MDNKLIRIDECGNVDTSFNSGNVGFDSYSTWGVYDIKVINGGSILVGGQFRKYNNITTNYFLKLNPNGTLDTSFNVGGSGFEYWTKTILVQPLDNKIIVTGNFETYNGVSSKSIVRLNPDGSRDNTFNVGTGFIGSSGNRGAVDGSYLQSDGKVVAVGRFTSYNGTPCNNIIRLKYVTWTNIKFFKHKSVYNRMCNVNDELRRKICNNGRSKRYEFFFCTSVGKKTYNIKYFIYSNKKS